MNKKRLLGIVLALACVSASAEVQPMRISFQGKLINPATNNPNTSATVNLTFKLYNDPYLSGAGNLLYTENQNNVPLTNGVFSVQIGSINAIGRDLFLGASVYLGVTVQGDSEMSPRQSLAMSAFAYTANQLSDLTEVRLIAGVTYSTFTNGGNFSVPGGIVGSSGTFSSGVTASSGTFLASGTNFSILSSSGILMSSGTMNVNGGGGIQNLYGLTTGSMTVTDTSLTVGGSSFTVKGGSATIAYGLTAGSATFTSVGGFSLTTSSGIEMQNGTLDINGGGGIDASGTGIWTSTLSFNAIAKPNVSPAGAGALYFDSTVKRLEISQDAGSWEVLTDTRTETMWIPTVTHPQATATSKIGAVANTAYCVRFYMNEDFLVNEMAFEETTAGGVSDVGFYNDSTKALVLHMGGQASGIGLKTAAGLSGFLQKGTMYRYCFCSASALTQARSVNATDVTNTLENAFVASPVEGTQAGACAAGVLPANLGTLVNASVISILSVIANTSAP